MEALQLLLKSASLKCEIYGFAQSAIWQIIMITRPCNLHPLHPTFIK